MSPEELNKLKQSNLSKLEVLAREGINIGPEVLAIIKIEELVDHVIGLDVEARAAYDLAVEKRKREVLDEVLKEIRAQAIRQKLILPK